MRIRSIKPEFWSSEDIAALDREDRLLFLGLWSYVDDNGVGRDDFRLITADLFPLDDPVDSREYVREGLATLSRHGLIARYKIDGRPYLFITGWKHQRVDKPGKPRYPLPPEDWAPPPTRDDGTPHTNGARVSRESPETLVPVTGEQGNRGTDKKTSANAAASPKPDDRFDEFWAAYPRRTQKIDARKAWDQTLRRKVHPEKIIAGAKRYARERAGQDPQFTKHPASWLRAGGYDDEPDTRLSLVQAGPELRTYDDYRRHAAGEQAARLLRKPYIPEPQPPGDRTHPRQWARDQQLAFVQAHEQQIRAALAHQETA